MCRPHTGSAHRGARLKLFFKVAQKKFLGDNHYHLQVQANPKIVSNAKGNLAKSNKSELCNRLSYRGLPYHFEVRSQTFRNNCKISRSQPQKFNIDFHSTSTTSKGLSENLKKMSWDNPVSPIDAKNSIGF